MYIRQVSIWLLSLLACSNAYAQNPKAAVNPKETVSATYTFDTEEELADWLGEGGGKAYIENGKLILEPLYFPKSSPKITSWANTTPTSMQR